MSIKSDFEKAFEKEFGDIGRKAVSEFSKGNLKSSAQMDMFYESMEESAKWGFIQGMKKASEIAGNKFSGGLTLDYELVGEKIEKSILLAIKEFESEQLQV